MPTVEDNRALWSRYGWTLDGDEWTNQAAHCGVPYERWKQQLVNEFMRVSSDALVIELGVGHGRWTVEMIDRVVCYIGTDVVPGCIDYCRSRWPTGVFRLTDGRTIPVGNEVADFVWSFDTFVHLDRDVVSDNLQEIARVLKIGARAVIHHPGSPSPEQREAGWRSDATATWFAEVARSNGLTVRQVDSWGDGCNTRLFSDCLSELTKV